MHWLGKCHAWAIHVPVVPASSKAAVVCFEHGSVSSLPQHLVEHRFWLQSAGGVWKHGGWISMLLFVQNYRQAKPHRIKRS